MRRLAYLAMLVAAPAAAQDFSMMANWAQGQMIQDNLQRNLGTSGRSDRPPVYATGPGIIQPRHPAPGSIAIPIGPGRTAPPAPVQTAAAPPIAGTTTAYHPSAAVSEKIRNEIVAVTAQHAGAQAAQSYAAMLAQQRPLEWWSRKASNDGLGGGDVADAMAEYWVQAWQLVNGVDLTTHAQMQSVRRQVRAHLVANPNFARMGDAEKQELAELLIYNQVSEGEAFFAAKHRGDTAAMERIRGALVASFQRQMHVDLHGLALTDTGFHIQA